MSNEQLFGVIHKFLFTNQETGFSVFTLHVKNKEQITVTGTFINVHAGQEIHLEGSWSFHAKFGKQFIATNYTTTLPTSLLGIKKYLGSGFIKGIGKVYADKIVEHFKEKTLVIIDQHPELLGQVPGVGPKRIECIKQSWVDQKYIAKIMVFLQEKGVTPSYGAKIYKKYGQQAIALLTENPYRLTDDIWGIGFATADKIAQNMGFATGSQKRFEAGIIYTLTQETGNGHVYQQVPDLKNKAFQILELDPALHQQTMKDALTNLYHADKIKLLSWDEQHFVGLRSFYGTEFGIAKKIKELLALPVQHDLAIDAIAKALQNAMHIDLNSEQQEGIATCLLSKVSIITGGPGTGKTTLVTTLLKLLDSYQITYKLAAPTGRAAKRLMESTQRSAITLHRLLEFDPSCMQFKRNEHNTLQTQILIVDEASMLDIFLMHALVKALPLHAHLVLIGDVDQLPSVGAGNVLQDLIKSDIIPCTKLQHIFRQAQNSMITYNAHSINQGIFPSSSIEGCKKDFYYIKEDNPEAVFAHIQKILTTTLAHHQVTAQNLTILTPMNRGAVGTQTLNYNMQQLLNPATTAQQATLAGTIFKINDRVMQIRNNYDKKVFNGDIGTIIDIDPEEKTLLVRYDGTPIAYEFDELSELVLAYAITIHKSQGSEYDAVIVPLFKQHFMLLQRNLIYTAITRAKKLCIFIGQAQAIAMGIGNIKQEKRITFLDKFLTNELICR